MIARSGLGAAVSREPAVLADALASLAAGMVGVSPDREYVRSFSRETQTRRLEELLERVVKEHGRSR